MAGSDGTGGWDGGWRIVTTGSGVNNHRPIVTYQADATIDWDSSGGRLPKDWHGPSCSALGGAAAKAEVVHKAMREATWWAKKGVPSFFKRSKNQHN